MSQLRLKSGKMLVTRRFSDPWVVHQILLHICRQLKLIMCGIGCGISAPAMLTSCCQRQHHLQWLGGHTPPLQAGRIQARKRACLFWPPATCAAHSTCMTLVCLPMPPQRFSCLHCTSPKLCPCNCQPSPLRAWQDLGCGRMPLSSFAAVQKCPLVSLTSAHA